MHGARLLSVRLLYTSLSLALLATAACGSDDDKSGAQATSSAAAVAATTAVPSSAPSAASSSPTAANESMSHASDDPAMAMGGGTVFAATYALTGAATLSGQYTDTINGIGLASCADVAAQGNGGHGHGTEGSFQVPTPPLTGAAADQLQVSVEMADYQGPKQYTGQVFAGNIQVEKGAYYSVSEADAVVTMTVKPDGSGEFIFKGAKDSASGSTLDGSITWTCATA